jgi:LmbE family N-acetylglucosaminyl deacetylase
MAERVSPVVVAERTKSRPERRRGRTGRFVRRILALVLVTALVLAAGVVTTHFLMLDRSAREVRATALIPDGSLARVLVVVAHPGDELEVAGTVSQLTRAGVGVSLLALTRGEARPPALPAFSSKKLAGVRADEFARSAEDILGAKRAKVVPDPDGTLLSGDPTKPLAALSAEIEKFQPSAIISVADISVPDDDARAAVILATKAAQESRTVARVWTVTRSAREVQWLSRAFGPVLNPAAQAPADVAVRIQESGAAKAGVLLAHGTQSPELGRDYPWATRIPAAAYFRFFDREYFHLLWGQPLG